MYDWLSVCDADPAVNLGHDVQLYYLFALIGDVRDGWLNLSMSSNFGAVCPVSKEPSPFSRRRFRHRQYWRLEHSPMTGPFVNSVHNLD